ncbi:hypothetical protein A7W90_12990 [Clostridium sp. Bc-iso-3]|nr:hypothetical protein A7W90_12990 [Clostridium sp. Bc-iso-3]
MSLFSLKKNRKNITLIGACIIVASVVDAATIIGVSSVTLTDSQKSNTGNLVALWSTSGKGRQRVKYDNGLKVTATAIRVQKNWFDKELKSMATTATSWSSWSSYFDLTEINVGYYAKIEGTTVAMSKAEFEVSQ